MAKLRYRKLQPDDPIFTQGPQVFVPVRRPTPEEIAAYQEQRQAQRKGPGAPATDKIAPRAPGGIAVDLEFMGETLESYYADKPRDKNAPAKRKAPAGKRSRK